VVLAGDPAGVTVAGLKLQETPDGRPEQAKLTVLLKPLTGVTVAVVEAEAEPDSVPLAGLMEREKSGAGAVMVTATALEFDAPNPVAPPYCASMLWLPTASVEVVRAAFPLASREIMPIDVPPSVKVTVPVGVAVPEAGVTCAVKVRLVPLRAEAAEARDLEETLAISHGASIPDYYVPAAWTAIGDKPKAEASLERAY
jgi:hypothetical protein